MVSKFLKILSQSYSINKKNKKTIIFGFVVFFITSVLIFILAIIPKSLTQISHDNTFQPTSDYLNTVEYADYPMNQVVISHLQDIDPEQLAEYSTMGFNEDSYVNHLKFERGFESFNPNVSSDIQKNIPFYDEFGLKEKPSSTYTRFQDFLNYYYHLNNQLTYPKAQPDKTLESMSFGTTFGLYNENLASRIYDDNYFDALSDYSNDNPIINNYDPIYGMEGGLKWTKNPDGSITYLGGQNNDMPINNLGKIFQQCMYEQLPYFLKHNFYNNNFLTTYREVPVTNNDEKFTYLNGYIYNKATIPSQESNSQLWGLSDTNKAASQLKIYNNSIINNVFDTSSTDYADLLSKLQTKNASAVIPCIVNKTFAQKFHIKTGQNISYHVNVPLLKYKSSSSSSNADSQKSWKIADPKGFFVKGDAEISTSHPIVNSGLFYHNMGGDTNSITYLNQANFENDNWQYNKLVLQKNGLANNSNYQFKIEAISDNNFNKPLIYTNQKIANYLHGYTKNSNPTAFMQSTPSDTDFNGVLSNQIDNNIAINYSQFGNYTDLGMNGSPVIYNPSNNSFIREKGSILNDTGPVVTAYDAKAGIIPRLGNNEDVHFSSSGPDGWIFSNNSDPSIDYEFSTKTFTNEITSLENIGNNVLAIVFVFISILSIVLLILLLRVIIYKYIKYIAVYKSMGYSNLNIFIKLFLIYSVLAIGAFIIAIPSSYFVSLGIVSRMLKSSDINFSFVSLDVPIFLSVIFSLLFLYFISFSITFIYLLRIKPLEAFIKSQ